MSPDDLDDIDGYFDRLPFDPRDTDYRQDIQDLYGQASDDVVGVMEELVQQREDATESAIESMFRETYNQGIIDGALAGAEAAGDDVDNHFPNGVYGEGGFMSPTYNFGVMGEQSSGGFMSPNYNFGAQGAVRAGGSDRDGEESSGSWDDFDWDGWTQVAEPQMSYDEFLGEQDDGDERQAVRRTAGGNVGFGASSPIIYNPQIVSDGGFFSGGASFPPMGEDDAEEGDVFDGWDMPWGDQAS
jgi:hypothetical protein